MTMISFALFISVLYDEQHRSLNSPQTLLEDISRILHINGFVGAGTAVNLFLSLS